MRTSRIKTKLNRNEPVLVTTLHSIDPTVYELTSLMGFDGIWMDLEHSPRSVETAQALLRASRVGTSDVIVRPAKGEMMRMGRILEAGAAGIMYPRCDNAEEAAEVVRWAKFPPLGRRGFDGGNADAPYCMTLPDDYVRQANEQTFIIIQIEDQAALEQAEAIANVEGVDALMLGPADFCLSCGIPVRLDHERVNEAKQRIAQAAQSAGKHWGCPCATLEQARQIIEMGARFVAHHADVAMIKNALEKIQHDFSEIGFSFENPAAG